jgi:2-keto-4-pentenoate hydratase/2-oxohepta-3-ene-1,7-dioic acid hydratase in catechol pathway
MEHEIARDLRRRGTHAERNFWLRVNAMRLARFNDNRLALVEGYMLRDITRVTERLPPQRWPLPPGDQLIDHLPRLRRAIESAAEATQRIPVSQVKLLSPVANPPRVIAAPINYRSHEAEALSPGINQGMDVSSRGFKTPIDKFGLFLKSPTSVVGPGEGIEIAFPERRNDYEVELAVVIGEKVKGVSASAALDCVAGYCIGLDISVRGTEDRSYRKSPDTYTVLGPWLVTADEIDDPGALGISLSIDGELLQNGNTRDLIVDVPDLIARASQLFTLHPGDVILTGTPEGVGPLRRGQTVRATIEKIGSMDVKVR